MYHIKTGKWKKVHFFFDWIRFLDYISVFIGSFAAAPPKNICHYFLHLHFVFTTIAHIMILLEFSIPEVFVLKILNSFTNVLTHMSRSVAVDNRYCRLHQ